MKRTAIALSFILALLFSSVAGVMTVDFTSAQSAETIKINNDGTITPSNAPVPKFPTSQSQLPSSKACP